MTVKVQLTRLESSDMVLVLNKKMLHLQTLFGNPLLQDDLCRRRDAVNVFYGPFCAAELNRVRTTILNIFRSVCVPVSILVSEGVLYRSGRTVGCKTGPNAKDLGLCKIFTDENLSFQEQRISVAEVDYADQVETGLLDSGENLYVVASFVFLIYRKVALGAQLLKHEGMKLYCY